MKICHVTLIVKDMDASLGFYTGMVGLPVRTRYEAGPDTAIVFLGDGETKLELICYKDRPAATIGNGISIGFEVGDLAEKLESIQAAGIAVMGGIIQPNPHVRFFYAADPDGYRVQFLENCNP